jgi:ribosomal protein S18 acetylase RimI-like enzyme
MPVTDNTGPDAGLIDGRLPEMPEIEVAYRTAHRALEGIIAAQADHMDFAPEAALHLDQVLSQFPFMVREAEMAVTTQIGPVAWWQAPGQRDSDGWGPFVSGIDLDNDAEHGLGVKLAGGVTAGEDGTWHGSSLDQAARAYRRAAHWDFAPDDTGIWLLMLVPVSGIGGGDDEPWSYTGRLAGFIILYDRDEDGEYEAVGHIWTAAAWRRRGIARRLLREARSRFGARDIERPYTKDGEAFIRAFEESSE